MNPTVTCLVRAARLFHSLRSKGITVRRAVDCAIAQTCLDIEATLLSPDADSPTPHLSVRGCWIDRTGAEWKQGRNRDSAVEEVARQGFPRRGAAR